MRSRLFILTSLLIFLIWLQNCQLLDRSSSTAGPDSGLVIVLDTGSKSIPEDTVIRIGNKEKSANGLPVVVFKNLPAGDFTLVISAEGFSPYRSVVSAFPDTVNPVIVPLLPALSSDFEYDGGEIKFFDSSMDVLIPPDTFEGLEEGQTLTIRRSHIDVKSDMVFAMPGDFSAADSQGNSVELESFGAFELTALSDGKELQIQEGKTIQVMIPFQGEVEPGQTHATLWSFDETSGKWKEEMEAPLVRRDGRYWVDARIPHLSYWNVDAPIEEQAPIIVRRVRDKNGKVISAPAILAHGLDYNGISHARSHQYGPDGICIQVKRLSRVRLTVRTVLRQGFGEFSREIQSKGPGTCANPTNAVYIDEVEIAPRELGSFLPGTFELPYVERITMNDGQVYLGMIIAQIDDTLIFLTRNRVIRLDKKKMAYQTFL
ncbi:MAG: hypothetical protein RH862_13260 [Leptospiraceae bacterium]